MENDNERLRLKRKHQYFYQVQTQLFVTRLLWCDFVIWTPNEICVERIYYDQQFIEEAILKARTFYFNVFLPSVVPYMLIHDGDLQITNQTSFSTEIVNLQNNVSDKVEIISEASPSATSETPLKVENDDHEDVTVVGVSKINKPPSLPCLLQQLHYALHKVTGDGNCLYHAITHQAGFIKPNCYGDTSVVKQLRILALHCMRKYPDVHRGWNYTASVGGKKVRILHSTEWGGDLEVRLLAIGIGRVVVITGSGDHDIFTSARKFPCHPPPVSKMKGGIFIPIELPELAAQWKNYKPSPLLIIYNGINQYDSTIFIN